ncbi:hypothetical protein GCM10009802_45420 [Streptomyces synnematoformans]|uniref:Uncharacterized protein n=1 Tax=Streptomyces synnematoformans TaxID=415721 RepID=A0ABP5KVV5_9ACTN
MKAEAHRNGGRRYSPSDGSQSSLSVRLLPMGLLLRAPAGDLVVSGPSAGSGGGDRLLRAEEEGPQDERRLHPAQGHAEGGVGGE